MTQELLIYIDRNRIQFAGGVFETTTTLNLPVEVVKDLDVLDKKTLVAHINNFVKPSKNQTPLNIILADQAIFIKEFPLHTKGEDLQKLENQFMDSVPFNNVIGKTITTNRAYESIALNAEIVQAVLDVLSAKGFVQSLVIPAFLTGMDFRNGLTDQLYRDFLAKKEKIEIYNIVGPGSTSNLVQSPPVSRSEPQNIQKPKSRLPLLVGIFVSLLIILVTILVLRKPAT